MRYGPIAAVAEIQRSIPTRSASLSQSGEARQAAAKRPLQPNSPASGSCSRRP